MKPIPLDVIKVDGGTQPRVAINEATVAEYAEILRESSAQLPPVVVFFDGIEHWLADGFHRVHAHRSAGRVSIVADVRTGTRRDAVLHSLSANAEHGLRRSNEDKRKAVQTMLDDPEWSTWSDRKIAEACRVGHPLVASVRGELTGISSSDKPTSRKVVTKHGTQTTMAVAGIAKANKERTATAPPAAAAPVAAPERQPATTQPSANDDSAPDEEEIARSRAEYEAELIVFNKLVLEDDKLAAAVTEAKRLTAETILLNRRINALMGEVAAAVRQTKHWQAKAQKAERAAA